MEEAVAEYVALERRAGALVVRQCEPWCASCRRPCCKPEFCAEAEESAWLTLVRFQAHSRPPGFAPGKGFLRKQGCALYAGRPPGCYQFMCDRIKDQAGPEKFKRMKRLASLISEAGEKALGTRHLVTLDIRELQRMNLERLIKKIKRKAARV